MTATPAIDAARIAALVAQQRDYFAGGETGSLEFRRQSLTRLQERLISFEKPLLAALHADLRKSAHEAYASEIALVHAEITYALKHLKAWMKPKRCSVPWMVFPAKGRVERRPHGVTLIIGPWNFPVQLVLMPLVGAIAGGNCAIVKPSEFAPAAGQIIFEMLGDIFAKHHIACVQGDRQVSEILLCQRFDHIFFTGGNTAGRAVAEGAARQLVPVTLELGGKCPVIVCADANVPVAARRIIWAKTMNAGQSCVAPDYLLVHRSLQTGLIDEMVAAIHHMFGSDVQKSPDFGRIVNRRHFDRLLGYLSDATICSGGQHDAADLYLAPTILQDVRPDAPVLHEEIFGPVLPVVSFDDLSEAMDFVNRRSAPLAVYLFTARTEARRDITHHVRCGGICVNDLVVQIFGRQLPFGGVGESGMGNYHGKASFDCFTRPQSILECSTRWDSAQRYPPPRLSMKRFKRILPWLLRG